MKSKYVTETVLLSWRVLTFDRNLAESNFFGLSRRDLTTVTLVSTVRVEVCL